MRALTHEEMNQVSGGTFCFSLFSLFSCRTSYSYCQPKTTTCDPKPSCEPAPTPCEPKPTTTCNPKPSCEPKPTCGTKPVCPPVTLPTE